MEHIERYQVLQIDALLEVHSAHCRILCLGPSVGKKTANLAKCLDLDLHLCPSFSPSTHIHTHTHTTFTLILYGDTLLTCKTPTLVQFLFNFTVVFLLFPIAHSGAMGLPKLYQDKYFLGE